MITRRLSTADAFVGAGALALALAAAVWSALDVAGEPQRGPVPPPGRCAPGQAAAGPAPEILLRRPANHDPGRPYPLLVAFPPAGYRAAQAERFYDLTGAATAAGFLVAYSDAIPPSRLALDRQDEIAARVAGAVCVDETRIAYLGHSDGGALAETLALRRGRLRARAIFASAAGVTQADLAASPCVGPVDVMIAHNRADARFPDFGRAAANYWAACARCEPDPLDDLVGCRDFQGCVGVRVSYCATTAAHETFPPLRQAATAFLAQALRAETPGTLR